jgi:hypothetical protein
MTPIYTGIQKQSQPYHQFLVCQNTFSTCLPISDFTVNHPSCFPANQTPTSIITINLHSGPNMKMEFLLLLCVVCTKVKVGILNQFIKIIKMKLLIADVA